MSEQRLNNFNFWGVVDGKNLFNKKLYVVECDYPYKRPVLKTSSAGFVLSSSLDNVLSAKTISNFCDKTFVPKKDDPVYLSPDCILARDDVRKQYKLKRAVDTGVCNVVSGMESWIGRGYGTSAMVSAFHVYGDTVVAFTTDGYKALPIPSLRWIENVIGIPQHLFEYRVDYTVRLFWKNNGLSEIYQKLLTHTNKTPIIHHSSLQIDGCAPLTMDTLTVLEKTAQRHEDSGRQLVLALQGINQCSWRQYPGTLSLLWWHLFSSAGAFSEYHYLYRHRSMIPKAALALSKFLYSSSYDTPFASDDDYNLALNWMNTKLGITKEQMFIPLEVLEKHLSSKQITKGAFNKVYDNIIRVRPKHHAAEG